MGISEEDLLRQNLYPVLLQSGRRGQSSWTTILGRVEQRKECWEGRLQHGYPWDQMHSTRESRNPLGAKAVEEVLMR